MPHALGLARRRKPLEGRTPFKAVRLQVGNLTLLIWPDIDLVAGGDDDQIARLSPEEAGHLREASEGGDVARAVEPATQIRHSGHALGRDFWRTSAPTGSP